MTDLTYHIAEYVLLYDFNTEKISSEYYSKKLFLFSSTFAIMGGLQMKINALFTKMPKLRGFGEGKGDYAWPHVSIASRRDEACLNMKVISQRVCTHICRFWKS